MSNNISHEKGFGKAIFSAAIILCPWRKTEMETKIEIKEEGEEALPDEEEPIRREEGKDVIWINSKLRKSVQKHIRVLEQQQADGQFQANS